MTLFEYKIIPAPSKPRKIPGIKGAEARFAASLEQVVNDMAAEGWEYQRADILPSEERQGLTSTQTVYRSVLVFRRGIIAVNGGVEVADMVAEAEEPLVEGHQEAIPQDGSASEEEQVRDDKAEVDESRRS